MEHDCPYRNEVFVESFEVDASIGVFDWEKEIKQKLVFDLVLQCDFSTAATSDHIDDAIDYVAVCEEIERLTLAKHYHLLEALAETLVESLLRLFPLLSIDLKISKPGAVAKARTVGVRVFRSRENH